MVLDASKGEVHKKLLENELEGEKKKKKKKKKN